MGYRTAFALTIPLLAGPIHGCDRPVEPTVFRARDVVPVEWTVPGSVTVVWLLRTRDVFTCDEYDYVFRRVLAAHGERVRFHVIHVGSPDFEYVPVSYMASRRVPAAVKTIAPEQFERDFPRAVVPILLVVAGTRVEWSSTDPDLDHSQPVDLPAIVGRALQVERGGVLAHAEARDDV